MGIQRSGGRLALGWKSSASSRHAGEQGETAEEGELVGVGREGRHPCLPIEVIHPATGVFAAEQCGSLLVKACLADWTR